MKTPVTEQDLNPFAQGRDPREVMDELLKRSKRITIEQLQQRMKEAVEAQKKDKLSDL
jgi:hypothetical protein